MVIYLVVVAEVVYLVEALEMMHQVVQVQME